MPRRTLRIYKSYIMIGNQPRIAIPLQKKERFFIRLGWLVVVLHFIVTLVFYFELPDSIPTHYNFSGQPNGFGDKTEIWTLPILNLVLFYSLNFLIKKIKPWYMNYPVKVTEKNAPVLYSMNLTMLAVLGFSTSILFLILSVETILIATENHSYRLSFIVPLLIILITMVPFYFIIKMFNLPKT